MSMLQILGMVGGMMGGQSGGAGGATPSPQTTPTSGPDARMGSNLQFTKGTAGPTGMGMPGKTQLPTSIAPGAAENPSGFAPTAAAPSTPPTIPTQNIPTGGQNFGDIKLPGNLGTSTQGSREAGNQKSQEQIAQAIAQLQALNKGMPQKRPIQPLQPAQMTGF
jgi:hypothetical protein